MGVLGSSVVSSGFSAIGSGVLGSRVFWSCFSGVVGVDFWLIFSLLDVGVSCFLGVDLLIGGGWGFWGVYLGWFYLGT